MIKFQKSNQNPFFKPEGKFYWNKTHAMLPILSPYGKDDSEFSIFYCSRNNQNQSFIGRIFINLDQKNKLIINDIQKEPILSPGELGHFDDNGVSPSCHLKKADGTHMLFYMGWKPRSTTRFSLVAGLAISEDGKTYHRYSKSPILFNSNEEPISILTAPWVIEENGIYRMWYVSGIKWIHSDLPKYNIKYAESLDGFKWKQTGKVALDNHNGFTALARPCVLKIKDDYFMWYSAKKPDSQYNIYCAVSKNGIDWDYSSNNIMGLFKSEMKGRWDSQMIEYAHVSLIKNKLVMLFNGNDYGKSGMGLATAEI